MKLISWNVNGLRACINKGFIESFNELGADIFCVQETKMQQGQAEFEPPEYHQYWNSAVKKGYSGTAVFTRIKPVSVSYGMGESEHDQEGRIITLEFQNCYLVNCYTPNSQRELLRLSYRMRWEDSIKSYLLELDKKKPVILCGDLNVAHNEIDIKNARSNRKNAGFTDDEREKMTNLLDSGFADTFRELNPGLEGAYTWWSYFANARERNIGWRIDYFLVSKRIMENVATAAIHPLILGSDHCPVELQIDVI